jgi:hypothetical protein
MKRISNIFGDELAKSRHPGENRGPEIINYLIKLDSGFRRNDENGFSATFCESVFG